MQCDVVLRENKTYYCSGDEGTDDEDDDADDESCEEDVHEEVEGDCVDDPELQVRGKALSPKQVSVWSYMYREPQIDIPYCCNINNNQGSNNVGNNPGFFCNWPKFNEK